MTSVVDPRVYALFIFLFFWKGENQNFDDKIFFYSFYCCYFAIYSSKKNLLNTIQGADKVFHNSLDV
jgi:hypothetical protein